MSTISKCIATSLAALALSVTSLFAQSLPTPRFFFDFENATDQSFASTGGSLSFSVTSKTGSGVGTAVDMLSPAGLGVGGGHALDIGKTGIASARASASLASTSTIGSMTSFTVTGWIKASALSASTSYTSWNLFNYGGASNQINISAASDGSFNLKVNNVTLGSSYQTSTNNIVKTADAWIFFAVSYDNTKTSNNLTYFVGTESGVSATYIRSDTNLAQGVGTGAGDQLILGNRGELDRAFDGMIDKFALYGATDGSSGALSKQTIEAIYNAQRLTGIPEPATATLVMSVSALAICVFSRFGRRRSC